MKIKLLLAFSLLFVFNPLKAQFNETIISASPGITNGPFSVGKGVFQIQNGVSFEKWEANNGSTTGKIVDNKSVLRIGVFERTEIRGTLDYNFLDQYSFIASNIRFGEESRKELLKTGFANSSIGIRQNLTKQDGLIPSFGLQLAAQFGGNKSYKSKETNIQLRILLQYKLFDKLVLNTNLTGNTQNNNLQYTFSSGYLVSKKIRVIAEMHGTRFSKDSFFPETITTNFNLGAGYLLTDNLQLDLFGGLGTGSIDLKFAIISAGVSYGVHKRE